MTSQPINVGDYVRGHDPDYGEDLAGVVSEVVQARSGELEALFTNELEGAFQGQRVALPARWITSVGR